MSLIELAIAGALVIGVMALLTFAVARSFSSRQASEVRRDVGAQLAGELEAVAVGDFDELLDYDELISYGFNPPNRCDAPDDQTGLWSCFDAGQNRTVFAQWTVTPGGSTVTSDGDGNDYVDLTLEAAFGDGTSLTRTRRVLAPAPGYTAGVGTVRVTVTGDLDALDGDLTLVGGTNYSTVIDSAAPNTNGIVILRATEADCNTASPCQVGLSSGTGFASNADVAIAAGSVVGPGSKISVTGGGLVDADARLFSIGDASIELRARNNGAASAPGQLGSVCLWGTFDDGAGRRTVPLCNTTSAGTIDVSGYTVDGIRLRIPTRTPISLSVDRPDRTCPYVDGMVGHTNAGWRPAAVCTSWTWGAPAQFGPTGQLADFDGAAITLSPSQHQTYQAVWEGDSGRPAAGYDGEASWDKPREAAGCAFDGTCSAVADITPEVEECPGEHCLSSRNDAPRLTSPPAVGGRYGVAVDGSTSFTIGAADDSDQVTLRVDAAPNVGSLTVDGVAAATGTTVVFGSVPGTIGAVYTPPAGPTFAAQNLQITLTDSDGVSSAWTIELYQAAVPHQVNTTAIRVPQGADASFEVTVTAYDGTPVEGVDVSFDEPDVAGVTVGSVVPLTNSDGVARFTISAATSAKAGPGQLTVHAGPLNDSLPFDVAATAGALDVTATDATQGNTATVTVTATDIAGDPMAGVVTHLSSRYATYPEATTILGAWAHWTLDETAGTAAADVTGGGHDAVLAGAATTGHDGHRDDSTAVSRPNQGAAITVAGTNLDVSGGATATMWLNTPNPGAFATYDVVRAGSTVGGSESLSLRLFGSASGDPATFQLYGHVAGEAGPVALTTRATYPVGVWTQLGFSYDPATGGALYVNGIAVAGPTAPRGPLVGAVTHTGTYVPTGGAFIDDVVVYDTSLPAASVTAAYRTSTHTGSVAANTGLYVDNSGCETAATGACSVTTTADSNAPAGVYIIDATSGSFSASTPAIVVAAPASITAEPVDTAQGATFTAPVTVTDATGAPMGGLVVTATSASGITFTPGVTGPDGIAVISGTVDPDAEVGSTTADIDVAGVAGTLTVNIAAVPANLVVSDTTADQGGVASIVASVTGTVGNPMSDIEVVATSSDTEHLLLRSGGTTTAPATMSVTGGNGTVTFEVVVSPDTAPGDYTISVEVPGTDLVATSTITVSPVFYSAVVTGSVAQGGQSTIEVTVRDGQGNPLAGLDAIVGSPTLTVNTPSVTSNGAGTFSVDIDDREISPAGANTLTIQAQGRTVTAPVAVTAVLDRLDDGNLINLAGPGSASSAVVAYDRYGAPMAGVSVTAVAGVDPAIDSVTSTPSASNGVVSVTVATSSTTPRSLWVVVEDAAYNSTVPADAKLYARIPVSVAGGYTAAVADTGPGIHYPLNEAGPVDYYWFDWENLSTDPADWAVDYDAANVADGADAAVHGWVRPGVDGPVAGNSAFWFNGLTAQATSGNDPAWPFADELTISGWVKVAAGRTGTVSIANQGGRFGVAVTDDGRIELSADGDSWATDPVVVDHRWNHIVVVNNADSTWTVYLNGTVVTTSPVLEPTNPDTTFPFAIGLGDGVASIAHVSVIEGAWSAGTVADIYDAAGYDPTIDLGDVDAPAAPAAPTAVGEGRDVTVSWLPPTSDGGSPVTSYLIVAQAQNSPAAARQIPWYGGPLNVEFTNLTSGVTWTFNVTAINAAGAGLPSADSEPVLIDPSLGAIPGELVGWGSNTSGQVGVVIDSGEPVELDPVTVPLTVAAGAGEVTGDVAGGANHSCAVINSNARCWGDNTHGQLGDGTTNPSSAAVHVDGLPGPVSHIAAGVDHSCAIVAGQVWCWGSNTHGQLGDGTTDDSTVPVLVEGFASQVDAVAVDAGARHSCAVASDGTAWCWGDNTHGQLGRNSTLIGSSDVAIVVSGVENAVDVAAGAAHSCVAVAGTVECFGSRAHGQLGDGTVAADHRWQAAAVATTATTVTRIAAGANGNTTCAIRPNETLCWGENTSGQTGHPESATVAVPTAVPAPAFEQVAVGDAHVCAIDGGELWCWGLSADGRLGDGVTDSDVSAPAAVSILDGEVFRTVAAGGSHSLATKSSNPTPSAPAGVSAVFVGGAVHVEWTATTAQPPVTHYEVAYRPDGGDTWTVVNAGIDTATTVSVPTYGTVYEFRVRAHNTAGASPWSTTATVLALPAPSAPTSVVATRGDSEATVSWSVPDIGDPIEGYTIEWRLAGAPTWTTVDNGLATVWTVDGLINGSAYEFRVQARNPAGAGAWSSAATVVPAGAPDAPDAPAVTSTPGALSATWTVPAENGSVVSSYTVEWRTGAGAWSNVTVPAPGLATTISGLTNGTSYQVRVSATNDMGISPWSSVTTGVPYAAPDAPGAPTATPGPGELAVDWVAPADGGSAITSYDVSWRPTSGGAWQTANTGSAVTSHIVDGLAAGTDYDVRVRAHNTIGTSPWSAITVAAPYTTPGQPSAPLVVDGPGSGVINISWEAHGDVDNPVFNYDISYREQGGPDWTTISTGSALTSHQLGGLIDGVTYEVRVRGTNDAGDGPWSPTGLGGPYTAPDAPGAPTVVDAAGSGSVTVSWAAPANGGNPITGYEIRVRVPAGEWGSPIAAASTSTVVEDLTDGATYEFSVRAGNAAGSSSWSDIGVGGPYTTPDAPSAPSTVAGANWVDLDWSAPATGGSPIVGYDVRWRTGAGAWTVADVADVVAWRVEGLDGGDTYEFSVRARNAAGNSPWSEPSNATPYTTPGAPLDVVVTGGAASGQLVVSWSAPATGGSPITGYAYRWRTGAGAWTTVDNAMSLSATIDALTNGTVYEVAVQATNAAGQGVWSPPVNATPFTTPNAPVAPGLTTGDSQITVTIVAPANGGNPIVDYTVAWRPDGGSWTEQSTAGSLSWPLGSLNPSVTYEVRVRAHNAAGASAWSPTSTAVPFTVPSAPGAPTVTPAGSGAVTVSWAAPVDGGSPITSYDIDRRVGAGPWTTVTTGTAATSAPVTGLANGTTYTFRVRASNAAGSSAWSATATGTPVGAPSAPGAPTVVDAPGSGSVTATWTAPADNGGLAIVGYEYQYRTGAGAWTGPVSEAGLSATIGGLTNGTTYQVQVRAINAAGSSDWSATGTGVPFTVASTPGAPTVVDAAGSGSVTATWTAPANGGSAITGYEYQYRTGAGAWTGPLSTAATSVTITGLTNGASYQVQVRAINAAGASDWSTAGTGVPFTVPAAPAMSAVTADNRAFTATWTAPGNGGSAITTYWLEYKLATDSTWYRVTGAATTQAIGGQALNRALHVRVAAVNAAGASAYSATHTVTPWSDYLNYGETLSAGQQLRTISNNCQLVMQTDANLVRYCSGATWASSWAGGQTISPPNSSPTFGFLPSGGLHVAVDAPGCPPYQICWAPASSAGHGGYVVIQGDTNIVHYSGGLARWWSG